MVRLISTIIVQFASYASIVGLYFSLSPIGETRPAWHWLVLGAVLAAVIGLIYSEMVEFIRSSPKRYRTQSKINSYMCRWVSSGGRVVIFSRDMSWARDEPVRSILHNKARRDELTICLERPTALTDELRENGASHIIAWDIFLVHDSPLLISAKAAHALRSAYIKMASTLSKNIAMATIHSSQ